ncbi:NADH dehydrogenase [ubiquinone] 1 alpha subcomplex subunit 9, mitochondrial isoform X2 [Hydra vulgaris]|uniref:NADH dehydrogenase [ubiquinone] 1 alpha subcomplex subunit 9, mitochondrial n=1 Tax=Hydra vulgaris TaxID=6087 RepID=A0ABM4BF74_HYDVU
MLSLNKIASSSKVWKNNLIPSADILQKRNSTSYEHGLKYGNGGRNSFNGSIVTVFGATGFLGRYVVNRLARRGTQLIIPYRGVDDEVRNIRLMGDLGQIKFFNYNLRDYESLLKTMTHSNTVINLVGKNFDTRNFTMSDCIVTGAADLAKAAKESGVQRFIHISALGAEGSSPSHYLQLKSRSERCVSDAFPGATIMRPAPMYGDEDSYFNRYAYFRNFPIGIPLAKGGWETRKRPVAVYDVARAIVLATYEPTTANKTYELYGPEEYYLHDIVKFIYRMIKRPCRIIPVPQSLYELAGYIGEFSPFDKRITKDFVIRQFLSDDVLEDAYTFEDLGITPVNVNNAALNILRRHRHYYHYSEIMKEEEFIKPIQQ